MRSSVLCFVCAGELVPVTDLVGEAIGGGKLGRMGVGVEVCVGGWFRSGAGGGGMGVVLAVAAARVAEQVWGRQGSVGRGGGGELWSRCWQGVGVIG